MPILIASVFVFVFLLGLAVGWVCRKKEIWCRECGHTLRCDYCLPAGTYTPPTVFRGTAATPARTDPNPLMTPLAQYRTSPIRGR